MFTWFLDDTWYVTWLPVKRPDARRSDAASHVYETGVATYALLISPEPCEKKECDGASDLRFYMCLSFLFVFGFVSF